MESTTIENVRVGPAIRLLNQCVKEAKKVAINSMNPVYFGNEQGHREIRAWNISVEGPPKHVSYFRRLISEANLKIG